MPFQIVVTVEMDFDDSLKNHKGLARRIEQRIETAADEMVEELAEDDMMPLYMNVKSEER
jgi:hypothetical protein